jgi:hypothetical protein
MNTQLITNVNFVELSFFKVGTHTLIYISSFAYINSIYFMDSAKTQTAVPEQNSKLNIYVYIQYIVTIHLFQLKLSQTIDRCTII